MKQKEGYIKQEDRKKILLLTDDIRVHSGVAQIGREMVINTSHKYNWVQLAGAVQHPEKGKRLAIYDKDANRQDGRLYNRPICGVYGINTWVYWRTTYDYMEITM